MAGYTRTSRFDTIRQVAAIQSVDVGGRTATGMLRDYSTVTIDIASHVGAIQVTPAVGEQWYIEKVEGVWKLDSKLPFNTADINNPPTQGQTQVGSSGPTELNGSQVNANAPIRLLTHTTSSRPDPATLDPGTMVFDTTLNQPIFSNGTAWLDASGSPV